MHAEEQFIKIKVLYDPCILKYYIIISILAFNIWSL